MRPSQVRALFSGLEPCLVGVEACAGADRELIRHQAQCGPDTKLCGRMRDLANERRRLFALLHREGEPSGINRIHRLYRGDGLPVLTEGPAPGLGTRTPILIEVRANARCWLKVVHDQFANGRFSGAQSPAG